MKISDGAKKLFIDYAEDSANWGGTPLVGGNVDSSEKNNGYLTKLKKEGLIETFQDEGAAWILFTKKGVAYAESLGIPV